MCEFIPGHRARFGVAPICAVLEDRSENLLRLVGEGSVETGSVGHDDHRDPGRLLPARPQRSTSTGVALWVVEDVGASQPGGHRGGPLHPQIQQESDLCVCRGDGRPSGQLH